ncbi:uncharacterized protein LOC111605460 [Drosophila hydei]|uniref:Uncharacterized protein LOC111605460 n=1 Tax=Drosophila hydei TaxID=7224 RepID=A0A6J1MRV6_DROHY|nr:uncharacterized protein LOC111605460 [Drosophila hydei]
MSTYHCAQLLLLLGLLCICAASYVQARPDLGFSSCAKNGQYCQMHRQCCSGKCMTYTYKCAPRVPQTLYDNKDSGADLSYFLDFWNPVYNPQRQEIEIVTLKNVDNVIGNSIQSTEKAGNVHDSSNPPIIGLTASCLPVGQPCTESSQCCRKRCHTYLHQCVT